MRPIVWVAILAALALAQGGRDTGEEGTVVLFLRWTPTQESGAIYNTTWKALEPHFGVLSRKRLFDFDGDPGRGQELDTSRAGLVVAFDAAAAAAWPREGTPILRAYGMVTDRTRLAQWVKLFHPGARRIALFGPRQVLEGYEVVACRAAADARGCDVAWLPEGSALDARALRPELDALGIPLVTSSPAVEPGVAALSVRPHPTSLGWDLAAVILDHVREGVPLRPLRARRLRVAVDLRAARDAGHEVPLEALARADVVRRRP